MNRLAALVALSLTLPARANQLAPATTDAQAKEARHLIESHNGAAARGCLTEHQVYEAYHRVEGALAWNPDNPVDWYVGRNTIGLFESLVMAGYGEASRTWNAAVNGTDFKAIGEPCRKAPSPRALAACINERVHAYFEEHPSIRPTLGGACKMYAATLVAVSSHLPAVTRQSVVVASAQHAFNRLTIRDTSGHDHEFLVDALNNLSVQLSDDKGACPVEGTVVPPPAEPSDETARVKREQDDSRRLKDARERIGRVSSAP
jgi:hypothetical protein